MNDAFERASTATRIASILRDRIAGGALAPGARIVETDVARELNVSRSPVREALLKLAEEGLVAIAPYRGAVVTPLHRERFVELMEFRLALERFALERLMERRCETVPDELRGCQRALRAALRGGDRRRIVDADLALHRTIVTLAGNALLEHAYAALVAQIRLYIDLTSARYERLEELADEHAALIGAIERGALSEALELLDAHVTHGLHEASLVQAPPAPAGARRRNFANRPR
jgi:DNA-binding GntR family transcriptional regulator